MCNDFRLSAARGIPTDVENEDDRTFRADQRPSRDDHEDRVARAAIQRLHRPWDAAHVGFAGRRAADFSQRTTGTMLPPWRSGSSKNGRDRRKTMYLRFICDWPPHYKDGQAIEIPDRIGADFVARCMAEVATGADVRE